jgi:hypothetical protein
MPGRADLRIVQKIKTGRAGRRAAQYRLAPGTQPKYHCLTETKIVFSAFQINVLEQLASSHADALTFHQVGYLLLTAEEKKTDAMCATVAFQRSL